MDKEQVKDIAKDCGLVVGQHWNRSNMTTAFMLDFANAAIESYKAELLNEVGEPVYQVCKSDSISLSSAWIDVTEQTYNDAGLYPEYGRRILYTSDQVAAAILKATKPLEERRCEICGYAEHHREHTSCLRTQLTAAQDQVAAMEERLERQRSYFDAHQNILMDEIETAEQRVSEACAELQFERSVNRHGYDKYEDAEAIRSGEWRKFVKEV